MSKFFLILLLISFTFAQDLNFPSQKLPPTIECGDDIFACLAFFFEKILSIILVLALVLSTIFIAWAGILYITKGGDKQEDINKIHQRLVWAAVGLIVALGAFFLVQALEFWITTPEMIHLVNFVYAQIEEPTPPERLECGEISLPSVFEGDSSGQDIWKICLLYYVQRALSLLYTLALMLGVIFISWAGILYIINPKKSKDIHNKLKYVIFGVILAILSFTIVKIIDLFFFNL
jgi:hypothetical protein